MEQPLGQVWIWLVVAGLAFFVLWRLAQGILNADGRDDDLSGWGPRIGALASGVAYSGLALYAAQRAMQLASPDGDGGNWIEWLMSQPFGRYLVGAAGLGAIAIGLIHIHYGATKGYRKNLDARADGHKGLEAIATYGLIARGVLFAIIGGLLVLAAFRVDPSEEANISDAMIWLRELPFGPYLYGAAALGLVAYGLYGLIQARYRQIDGPTLEEAKAKAKERARTVTG